MRDGARSIFYPPNRLCRSEFMEVCKLRFVCDANCEHVMCREQDGGRINIHRNAKSWVWGERASTHGAQLGLSWCRNESAKRSFEGREDALKYASDSSRIFYDFHLAWDRFCQFICYSVSKGKRVWWWTTKNLIENLGGRDLCLQLLVLRLDPLLRSLGECRNIGFEGARRIVTSETEINKYAPSESSFLCIFLLLKARLCVVVRRLLP